MTTPSVTVSNVASLDATMICDATGTPVSAANPLPVSAAAAVTYTDISGAITTGGAAQTAAAANANRRGLIIQNVSSGALYISTTGTASASVSASSGSIRLDAGAYWEAPAHGVPAGAVSIYGATTGQAWAGREW